MNTIKISFLALTLGLMSFATLSTISWKSETIDVGEISQNKPKAIVFEFKNTGKTDVVITNVQGSCGCTATNYTKTPIKAGKSGIVTATYNAANLGAFTKTVSVTTNAEATPKVLTLKGVVKSVINAG
ncbi:DUF1573 domain-containing protein [Flavobacterium sp.]|uniref:DUF1573 domain-containing protein n=1 Tax=Flavobacterium sp. TaxID=239 RepID=UPI00286B208C|nr:DUF1573 domain-containing protein [Flavobacterium sp.]